MLGTPKHGYTVGGSEPMIRLKTKVLPGNRVEIVDPNLPVLAIGERVREVNEDVSQAIPQS